MLSSLKPWFVTLLLGLALSTLVFPALNPYYQTIFMVSGLNIILAVSLSLINGFTGQFSLGHAGFMAIGGYGAAAVTFFLGPIFPFIPPHLLLFGALIFGGLLSAFCGWLVGLPSLRLKGDYLAIVTLGFGEIIRVVFLNIETLGGARGMTGIQSMTNQYWIIFTCIVVTFSVLRLLGSAPGRAMLAVREDEIAAEAMGVNTTATKVWAFVIGSFWAGIAGGLYAHYYAYMNPSNFTFMRSFEVIVIIVLGGLGSISGAIIAAILLTILPEALRPLQEFTKVDFRMIIYSLVLIIFMIVRPNGIFGRHELGEFFRRWKETRKASR